MNTPTTNLTTTLKRWVQSSHGMRGILNASLSKSITAVILVAVLMSGCRDEITGTVNVCVAPTVVSTSPVNGGTNEPLGKRSGGTKKVKVAAVKIITATFSTPMNPNTINTSTFTVRQGANIVSGTVSYSDVDTTATFVAPLGLSPNLVYTCTITTGVKDEIGTALAGNYVWTFTTIAAGTPTLVSPIDGALNQPINPTLIWNVVPGASTYHLQVSTTNTFATTVFNDSTITGISHQVTGLSVGTVYFWRVNSKIAGGTSAYSNVWSFGTITIPAAPTLISPNAGATGVSTSPTFTWNAVVGASTYHIQVSISNTFATTIYNDSTITGTAQSLVGLTSETVYYWRVRAKNNAGTSAYTTRSFTTVAVGTPTLISPVDGAVNQSMNPILIWNGVTGASSYRLQVSTDNSFATTFYNDSTLTGTSQLIVGLSAGTTYYWRLNSKISDDTSPYSTIWSFTTIAVPPAPVLIAPIASAINISSSPTFSWNSSAGANTYRLQVSTSNTFATFTYDNAAITNTSQQVSGLVGGTQYFWRVSATNAAGTSAYSTRSFTTIAAGTPILVAPVDGALNQVTNPTLVWNVVPGANTYRLQVSTSNTFATTVYNDSTLTNASQLVSGLSVGTTYFWRVNSKISGGTSAYSDIWSFTTIAPPAVPVLVSPLNAATNLSVTPTLIWNDVPGAETYRLQVSTDNTFATTVYNDSMRTSTSQQVFGLTVGTQYFWRVNAKNVAGTSAYSTVRSFTTIVVPAVPTLFSPADLATNQPVNPSLLWNSVPGADTYRLQVSTSNTFAVTVYDDSTRTSTSQQVTGLSVGTQYFWRVNAKNLAGTSAYSVTRSFTTIVVPGAPVLVAPLDLATNQPANPTMIWNSVPGANTYRLQVSTDSTFATTVYNDSTRTSTSQQMAALTVGTTYFWRVNAKNLAGTSVYSTVWRFNTTAVPLAPTLIAPLNLATNQPTNPTLSWNPSIGANSYRLQVSTSNTFATTLFNDSTITGTSQQIIGLNNGTTYFWRVNAKNGSGTSSYSLVRSFTVILAVPQPPILSSPLDVAIDQKLSLSLSWLASNGATTYRVQMDTSQTFANPIVNDSTITGLLKPVTGLKINTTYYWRVNAKNSGGTSAYSTVWRFTTGDGLAPGAVPLKSVGTFGIMATSAITNTGNSVVNGDVSLDPGTSITGFTFSTSPGPGVVNGTVHINDDISEQARLDLLAAYNFAKGKPPGTTITAGADLGALYPLGIPPGTYTSGSTMLVSTELVLDGGGNADAVWVFQIGSSLTTSANVSMTGGAQEKNIFWVPTEDATIGVGTIFHGTIISGRDVTAVTGATVNGRILAGAITAGTIALQTATVNVPLP